MGGGAWHVPHENTQMLCVFRRWFESRLHVMAAKLLIRSRHHVCTFSVVSR